MEGIVYIDGDLLPASEARVSLFDRGLVYSDGLFETMRVESGRVHLLRRHLRRLAEGAAALEIPVPDEGVLRRALAATIEANGAERGIVRLTLTRGVSQGGPSARAEHPSLFVWQRPLLQPSDNASLVTVTVPHRPPETPTRIKTLSYLGFILAAREAARRGADEGIMLTADGFVAEGSVSNVFAMIGGELRTAPISLGVLPGIARARVIELAKHRGLIVREEPFTLDELRTAEECFNTNAARGVVVAATIDGMAMAANDVGRMLADAYAEEMANEDL